MTRLSARLLALTLATGLLLRPPSPRPSPWRPRSRRPKLNATVSTMPALTWNKAKGASSYEVQIASDSGFNPALVTVTTANLRFVNSTMLPNGAYFWRVRSLDAASESSKWSKIRKFTKKWNATADDPDAGRPERDRLPESDDPELGARARRRRPTRSPWRAAPRAAAWTLRAESSRTARSRGATAASRSRRRNTNLAVSTALHPGTYYWQVIPVDAQGHNGTPSAIFSFAWIWAGTTTPSVTRHGSGHRDLRPVVLVAGDPGRGELRDRGQPDRRVRARLAADALVDERRPPSRRRRRCPTTRITGASAASIRRARPGRGTTGPRSRRPTTRPSCPDRRTCGCWTPRARRSPSNGHVNEPVVTWSTVPGARELRGAAELQRARSRSTTTANTAWTPLAPDPPLNGVPFLLTRSPGAGVNYDNDAPTAIRGASCRVSVRAFADNAIDGIVDRRPLRADASSRSATRRASTIRPRSTATIASCAGLLDDFDIDHARCAGTITGKSPLFCWTPADMDDGRRGAGRRTPSPARTTGSRSRATRNFTTSVEQAYTAEPCYAPARPMVDEGTLYYWQVIPAGRPTGAGSTSRHLEATGGFIVSPTLPARVGAADADRAGRRGGRLGGRRLQVGAGARAGQELHDRDRAGRLVQHDPRVGDDRRHGVLRERRPTRSGRRSYWRVRANNDDSKGLAWSGTSSFVQTLPVPTITTAAPFAGATFPALTLDAGRRRHAATRCRTCGRTRACT